MYDIKNTLRVLSGFVDNEYLDKYCSLITRNTRTVRKGGLTNSHHIIPKCWFKLNNQSVDNSQQNLVNLIYREHALAHYYLCLCTINELQYANELAFMCLITRKKLNIVDKQLITGLPLYIKIYESYKHHKHNNFQLYNKDE